jgi:hypothetical protein
MYCAAFCRVDGGRAFCIGYLGFYFYFQRSVALVLTGVFFSMVLGMYWRRISLALRAIFPW